MPVVRGMELGRELAHLVTQLNKLIEAEEDRAKEQGIDPIKARDHNGNLVMAPLLIGKAQALHALVLINQKA